MSSLLLALLALAAYGFARYLWNLWQLRDFPPGPPRLPVVGCLFSLGGAMGSRLIIDSVQFIPKYGDLIGYVVGVVKLVFVQDFDIAKEMAFSDKFTGRVITHYTSNYRGHKGRNIGVISTQGETWKIHRRFALSTLKEFGFGKKSMGDIIAEEAQEIVSHLESQHGKDVRVEQLFNIPVFNILWRIVAGKRYHHDDPQIKELQHLLAQVFASAFKDRPFPLLARMFPRLVAMPEKKQHTAKMKTMFADVIKEHQVLYDSSSKPKDFIDVYLKEMETDQNLNYHDLVGLCIDFFEAGGETVGSTLSWLLMYFALYQEEQQKCFQEIKENIDTLVFYNIYKFHTDPAYWGDPDVFRPDRFLEAKGGKTKVVKHERFIPFGFGKRICMGESLAKAELFIFAVLLIQRLHIVPPKSNPQPSLDDDIAGVTRSPRPFHVHVNSRHC